MNVDRYTKCVLTVIAGCLVWICAMGAGRPVAAQSSATDMGPYKGIAQPVVIVGTGTMDRTGQIELNFSAATRRTDPTLAVRLPYTQATPLPVSLPYTNSLPMAVEISAVRKTGEWEPIRVRVEDAPVRQRPGGGDSPR
jgi:hypothetical protein